MSPTDLAAFNALPESEARLRLQGVCASASWADTVAAARPFAERDDLYAAADDALAALREPDLDEALAGHPRIGERGTSADSRREQSGVSDASREALADGNRAYEERFGHVYLVCASGRTGDELLALLRERLSNDPTAERRVARDELGKINRLRLRRLVEKS
ncbi:MAG TPA: 2-oxo-4-hydroxy-4-carboxy-5-ureidoimidazoline decarboxylase [Actinomycetales bacterium]|nr:2-oxo-4-hydroxy-4-carboxy-5-ureidoimidazoline decarboxylase [Actinomycetales bacterium]